MLVGRTTAEKIFNFLINEGYTKAGAAGIMGNLDAESGLVSNNLEDKYEKDLGSNTYYTAAVNNKTYSKYQFMNDSAGYGLAQWTYKTRKQGLYENTVEKGISIADLEGQLNYLIIELKRCRSLDILLRKTNSVSDASDRVLKDFECPAVLNYQSRRNMSKRYYDRYAYGPPDDEGEEDPNALLDGDVYIVKPGDGWWSIATKELGSGNKMYELARYNGMTTSTMLHPGNILRLPIRKEDKEPPKFDTGYFVMYTIRNGDTWYSLATTKLGSGSKADELMKFNNMTKDNVLREGMKIKIPCSKTSNVSYKPYTVKSGDSWWGIATKEMGSGTKMHELANFNGKTIKFMLHPGMVLKIPKIG